MMGDQFTREQRRQIARDNAKRPVEMQSVPRDDWPHYPPKLVQVWRSRDYIAQVYDEQPHAYCRISVSRTQTDGMNARWNADGIPWEDLQRIKRELGYGAADAVEVYPADQDVVNVANMRHLWVLIEKLPFAWRK
jgi:hypothetical protein